MDEKKIPEDVTNLIKIIEEKYSNNNDIEKDYIYLIKYLYDEMCDEYLVFALNHLTGKPSHLIENDIYAVVNTDIDISYISAKLNIDFENL